MDVDFDPSPGVCAVLPMCLMCGGKMEMVFDLANTKACVCVDCRTEITVPSKGVGTQGRRA